jgi:hypothetical protein
MESGRARSPRGRRRRRKKTTPSPPKKRYDITVPQVNEPLPNCLLCGKVIDSIAQAISEGAEGHFSHFDCVLEKLNTQERIKENQKISYIGQGAFGVVEKDDAGNYTVVKRIPYESSSTFQAMQKFVEECKDEE